MSLLNTLQEDMKQAMRAGDKERLAVVRMLINEVKTADLNPQKPTPEQAIAAYGKKLKKSLEELEKLGRQEDAAKIRKEIEITDSYLPKKASAEETEKLVDEFLQNNSFTDKQLGQAMGAFLKAYPGRVDPGIANAALRKRLMKS